VGNALFFDADGFNDLLVVLPFFRIRFVVVFFCLLQNVTVVGARIGVNWSLRDQAIGKRDSDYAANKAGAAQKEEVPVESGWLGERKLFSLRGKGADVVIVVEEEGEEDADGEGNEDPFHR
jgi:hypothetical protein